MPIYDYKCAACNSTYDIYHKTREVAEDVVCPSCGSTKHTRLMSVPAAAVMNGASSSTSAGSSCESGGGCCGGACGVN